MALPPNGNIPASMINANKTDFNQANPSSASIVHEISHSDLEEFKQTVRDDTEDQKHDDRKRAIQHHKAAQKAEIHANMKIEAAAEEQAGEEAVASETHQEETTGKMLSVSDAANPESEPEMESLTENPEMKDTPKEGAAAKGNPQAARNASNPTGTAAGTAAKASAGEGHAASEAAGSEVHENGHAPVQQATTPKSGSMASPQSGLAKSGAEGASKNPESAHGETKTDNPARSKGKESNAAPSSKAAKAETAAPWISLSSKPAKMTAPKPGAAEAQEPGKENATPEEHAASAKSTSTATTPSQPGLPTMDKAKIISGKTPSEASAAAEQAEGGLPAESAATSESSGGKTAAPADSKSAGQSAAMPADSKMAAPAAVVAADSKVSAPASGGPAEGQAAAAEEGAPPSAKASAQSQPAGAAASQASGPQAAGSQAAGSQSAGPGGPAASNAASESGSGAVPAESAEGQTAKASEGNVRGNQAGMPNSSPAATQSQNAPAQAGKGEAYDYAGAGAQEASGSAKASQGSTQPASQAATQAAAQGPQTAQQPGGTTAQGGPAAQGGAGYGAEAASSDGAAAQSGPAAAKPESQAASATGSPGTPSANTTAAPATQTQGSGEPAAAHASAQPTPAGGTPESSEGRPGQASGNNAQAGQAGSAGSNQAAAQPQGAAAQSHGEAYDYAGKAAQETPGAATASQAPQASQPAAPPSEGAAPQNRAGSGSENVPADRAVAQPGQASAMPEAQTQSASHAATNPGESGDPRNPQLQQGSQLQSTRNAQNPVLRTNDPSVVLESEGTEGKESVPNPGAFDKGNGTFKNSQANQIGPVAGPDLLTQPQGQANPADSAGSELARDVMDMVGRLLISANPWAPIQEIRLVLNSEVVPNTEIQMRMASGSVDVNIISDNNESLALLGRAGAGLTKTLENTTPGVVRVQLFNGNMESVRMDTGDYPSSAHVTQPQAQAQEPERRDAPVVEAYDYRGQHQLQSRASQPMPQPGQLLQVTPGLEIPIHAESAHAIKSPMEILEIEKRELDVSKLPAKTEGSKSATDAAKKTDGAKGVGSSDLSLQSPDRTQSANNDSALFDDVSQLVGRMLISANPWAPVQEIRLILNSEVVPSTEIQMRLESGRVDINIISDNGESLGILGKAGAELSLALETTTAASVKVQMFNGNGERVEMGNHGTSGTPASDEEGLKEEPGIFATEGIHAGQAPESSSNLPPAEEVMDIVGRLLESAEPWSPLREIRVAMNSHSFPDTEIQMRRETGFVDVNIISGNNENLELLELAAAGLVQPMDAETRGPVRVRVTSTVVEELP